MLKIIKINDIKEKKIEKGLAKRMVDYIIFNLTLEFEVDEVEHDFMFHILIVDKKELKGKHTVDVAVIDKHSDLNDPVFYRRPQVYPFIKRERNSRKKYTSPNLVADYLLMSEENRSIFFQQIIDLIKIQNEDYIVENRFLVLLNCDSSLN